MVDSGISLVHYYKAQLTLEMYQLWPLYAIILIRMQYRESEWCVVHSFSCIVLIFNVLCDAVYVAMLVLDISHGLLAIVRTVNNFFTYIKYYCVYETV
jgi:type III secretory pathway component EscT